MRDQWRCVLVLACWALMLRVAPAAGDFSKKITVDDPTFSGPIYYLKCITEFSSALNNEGAAVPLLPSYINPFLLDTKERTITFLNPLLTDRVPIKVELKASRLEDTYSKHIYASWKSGHATIAVDGSPEGTFVARSALTLQSIFPASIKSVQFYFGTCNSNLEHTPAQPDRP